jgi:hypothetical protein
MRNSDFRVIRLMWNGLNYDQESTFVRPEAKAKKIDLNHIFKQSIRSSATLESLLGNNKFKKFRDQHLLTDAYFNKGLPVEQNILSIDELLDGVKNGLFSSKRVHFYTKEGLPQPMSDYEIRRYNSKIHLEEGGSLSVRELQWVVPSIRSMAADLQYSFGCNFNVNAYLTPPQSQTFSLHWDDHDTLALQLAGTKTWTAYEPKEDLPVENHVYDRSYSEKKLKEIGKYKLTKGSFLYLPRGHIHKAITQNVSSLHITFGLHSIILSNFLKTIMPPDLLQKINVKSLRQDISTRSLMDEEGLTQYLASCLPKDLQKFNLNQSLLIYAREYWEDLHPIKQLRTGQRVSFSGLPFQWIEQQDFFGLKTRDHAVLCDEKEASLFKQIIAQLIQREVIISKELTPSQKNLLEALNEANLIHNKDVK